MNRIPHDLTSELRAQHASQIPRNQFKATIAWLGIFIFLAVLLWSMIALASDLGSELYLFLFGALGLWAFRGALYLLTREW